MLTFQQSMLGFKLLDLGVPLLALQGANVVSQDLHLEQTDLETGDVNTVVHHVDRPRQQDDLRLLQLLRDAVPLFSMQSLHRRRCGITLCLQFSAGDAMVLDAASFSVSPSLTTLLVIQETLAHHTLLNSAHDIRIVR